MIIALILLAEALRPAVAHRLANALRAIADITSYIINYRK